jgi:tetratricopeptide (TPR) repeat protein
MAERDLRALGWWWALVVGAAAWMAAPAAGESLQARLLAETRDGRLDRIDFVAAALIAGGVEDECELSGWLDCYAERRSKLLAAISEGPAAEQLRSLHVALHQQLLTGRYQTAASDLRQTLTTGDFNCLSSLTIYLDLCQAAGLDVQIWLARGHVNLRTGDDEAVVIEPGAPQRAGRNNSSLRDDSRQITPVELLGKFYYNRGVGLLQDRQFAEGLKLLEIAVELDRNDADARANLVAGFNNWAVEHCRASRYGEAAPLIKQGLRLDPLFAPLVANERLVRAKLGQ